MSMWTEATLRAAASWQAFKEGRALFAGGAVVEAKAGQGGWQGAVRVGGRLLRVKVAVKSSTDMETRCACPANQSTGELCAHAVAVGLATLTGVDPVKKSQPAAAAQPVAAPPVAREILWPPNWRESLARGKLAATVTVAAEAEITPADVRLAEWLNREGVATKSPLNLHLDGARVAAFLESIAGHPRVISGKDRVSVEIALGRRIRLAEALLQGAEVGLVPDPDAGSWCEIAGSFWQWDEASLVRAGGGALPASLIGIAGSLARGTAVNVPVSQLLDQLDGWQDWLEFPPHGWLESLHFLPAPATIHLTLDGSLEHLDAVLTVAYGNSPPVPPGLGKVPGLPRLVADHCEVRDFPAEERAVRRMESAGFQAVDPAGGSWSMRGESAVVHFLTHSLPALRERWSVTQGSRFNQLQKHVTVVSPKIVIRGSGEDWLGFDLTFEAADGTVIPTAEIRQLLRAGHAATQQSGRRRLIVSDEFTEIIEPLFSELELHQRNGHYEASPQAGEVIREISKKLQKRSSENDLHESFTFDQPATLHAELRPYQQLGAAWLWDRMERFGGALLADDMGLGKTIQTIAWIERLFASLPAAEGSVLVVATTTLLGNWRAEFGRFAPGRRVRILHGAGRDAEREKVEAGEVVLTSYGTLARDLAWHLRRDYLAVVVDEASGMRNPDTDHARAVVKLRAARRLALTGTPVENGIRDLWSIFRFIQPGWLGGREDFAERYERPLADGESSAAVMERLKLKTQPFLLRRTKEQVAPELPTKLIIDEFCDLSPDQQSLYRELLVEGRKRVEAMTDSGQPAAARMQVLTALLRLRQACCDLALLGNERLKQLLVARRSAKLQRLLELLEEAVNGNHKVLVFSQFQKQLLEIEKCVEERGWGGLRLDGQTRNRQQLVDRFQSAAGPPIFLISLKAGGYGLNLTAADTVVHFDPWWNPAAEMQATDRAHRIGQTRPVTVYRLLTRGTVEEKVVRLQARKRELAAAIDEAGGGDAAGWSLADLQGMLTGE